MNLKSVLTNYTVYIDTCAMLELGRLKLFINQIESDYTLRKKVVILPNVVQELEEFAGRFNDKRRMAAIEALEILKNSTVFVCNHQFERKKRPFADPRILTTLIQNKSKYPQAIITFDRALAIDCDDLNDLKCINGCDILVLCIDENGNLITPDYLINDENKESNVKAEIASNELNNTTVEQIERVETINHEVKCNNYVVEKFKKVAVELRKIEHYKPVKKNPFWKDLRFWLGGLAGTSITSCVIVAGKKILKLL